MESYNVLIDGVYSTSNPHTVRSTIQAGEIVELNVTLTLPKVDTYKHT